MRVDNKNSGSKNIKRRSYPEQVTFDEYSDAMRQIIMYNSITDRQWNAMDDNQLAMWEKKKDEAWEVKRLYMANRNRYNK